MNFFESQERARKKTGLLLTYFVLAVCGIILTTYSLVWFFFSSSGDATGSHAPPSFILPELLGSVTLAVLLIISAGTLFKLLTLGRGGSRVAESLGGVRIVTDTQDPQEKRLLNIVEEMSIASGIPPPPVYRLPEPRSINAFAAGTAPENAVIGVTEGAMSALSRDELQGVIAHEFSHIFNGDMRLNLRLIGILHGILLLAILGEILLRSGRFSSGNKKGGGAAIAITGLGLMLIGQIGVFFGHLIKSAVSRQREYLADATAVQYTRYPDGLAGALMKIGGLHAGSRIQHPRAEEASHMFFTSGLRRGGSAFSGLATHPPLRERILRIDPRFDGEFAPQNPEALFATKEVHLRPETPPPSPLESLNPALKDLPIPDAAKPVLSGILPGIEDAPIGQLDARTLNAARLLMEGLPEGIRTLTHQAEGAARLVYAQLLRHGGSDQRSIQADILRKREGQNVLEKVQKIEQRLQTLPDGFLMPLLSMCVQGLGGLSRENYRRFHETVRELSEADHTLSLFEFTVGQVLFHALDAQFDPPPRRPIKVYSLHAVQSPVRVLLSALSWVGAKTPTDAEDSFRQALQKTDPGLQTLKLLEPLACDLQQVDQALDELQSLSFPMRKKLLDAALVAVAHDGEIRIAEAELFRATAASLSCPCPLWVMESRIPAAPTPS